VSDTADTRRPGRPRSPEAHAAILRAALELAVEGGLSGLSMEAIAARAGVGKATIYRRWKSKEALFTEAIQSIALVPETPDTGSVRGDIEVAATAALGRLTPEAFRLVPRLLAEAGDDTELHAALDAALLRPRRAAIREIFRRGIARGELRADIDIDLAVEMLLGTLVSRALVLGGDRETLAGLGLRVYDLMAAGIGAGPRVG
jgi:AcrR family transcriptional regulator